MDGVPGVDVTRLLLAWSEGEDEALEQLVPFVYEELHRLARLYMGRERPDHLLQTTALINEAYLKLADLESIKWQNRSQFFGVCARLMRRILVDFARVRDAKKRGGDIPKVTLDEGVIGKAGKEVDLLAIDEALKALASLDRRKSEVVELRYFGGLSVKETAEFLNVSPETVMRDWKFAKAWLARELEN
jgi:RNA polymerase sigma factor (TIGR02999 family)